MIYYNNISQTRLLKDKSAKKTILHLLMADIVSWYRYVDPAYNTIVKLYNIPVGPPQS